MKILLTTLHSKYSHASLALPYLASYCNDLPDINISLLELTINEPHEQLLRAVVSKQPDLIAFSCYIWNIGETLRLVSDIKKISPQIIILLGGAEVSFDIVELMQQNPAVDYVVKGEGEQVFKELLQHLIEGNSSVIKGIQNLFYRCSDDIITGSESRGYLELDSIPSPFQNGVVDFEKPLIYYETSRGCPFSCAFCLSSTERQVRSFSIERIKRDLLFLMERGTPTIKLVDRTFNYDHRRADEIWSFILEHNKVSRFHFEIAADLLTQSNLELLQKVPPDTFQFEIGIQSTHTGTLERVTRLSDLEMAYSAIRSLKNDTSVELHLDLVAGLPEDDYGKFLQSLQVLLDLEPHQIQVEPLKLLKGSRMREIAKEENYQYSSFPPYTILKNTWLTFEDIVRIETIGKLLDLFYNSRHFASTIRFLGKNLHLASAFDSMAADADLQHLHSISNRRAFELFYQLSSPLIQCEQQMILADLLFYDYCLCEIPRKGKLPAFISSRQQLCAWLSRKEIPLDMILPEGAKVTLFSYNFQLNQNSEYVDKRLFVYISAEKQGLKIVELGNSHIRHCI